MDKPLPSASVDAFHRIGAKAAFIELSLMPLLRMRGRWVPRPEMPAPLRDIRELATLVDETPETIAGVLGRELKRSVAELVQLARREAAVLPEGVFEEWNDAASALSAGERGGVLQAGRHLLVGDALATLTLPGTERGHAYAIGRLSSWLSLARARLGLWRCLMQQDPPAAAAPWHPWSVAAGIAAPLADSDKVLEEVLQIVGPASLRGIVANIETTAPSWPARPDVRQRVCDGAAGVKVAMAEAPADVARLLPLVEALLRELGTPGYGDVDHP